MDEVDCRSDDGITIGLIDSIISIAGVLSSRLENTYITLPIAEALKDLAHDDNVRNVFAWADHDIKEW